MLNKQNLAISALADRSKYARERAGILVSDNFTAATDSRVLAVVNRPAIDPADFPVSPDGTPAQPKQGRYILDAEDAGRLSKAIPKAKTFPILANIMPLEPVNGSRRFLLGEIGSMSIQTLTPVDQKFPNFKRVWPKGKAKFEISFSVELLGNLLATMEKASTKHFPIVSLKFYDPDKAARFQCKLTDEGQKMTGLIMPCQK